MWSCYIYILYVHIFLCVWVCIILPTTPTPSPVLSILFSLFKSLKICCDAIRKTRLLLQPKVALLVKWIPNYLLSDLHFGNCGKFVERKSQGRRGCKYQVERRKNCKWEGLTQVLLRNGHGHTASRTGRSKSKTFPDPSSEGLCPLILRL